MNLATNVLTPAKIAMESVDRRMLRSIERGIRHRTGGRICNLSVESDCELVIVRGNSLTFYAKQLALEATRAALGTTRPFRIDIDVA